ncbi:MAG: hypothetical protein A2Y50_07235 [Pseudomonadales bacterium RIFCSPLOWO2_12_59_9]|nr:MAG: hypothetical protein A2Y50_07235 [Pseudomonadales bacterium RIFCSPLOWO2_12_59_9]
MDSKINFTKTALDNLPLPESEKRSVYHDTKQPGLQLRVTSSGSKTFSVFARVAGGKPERITLGRFPAISPETARKKAKEVVAQLAQGESVNAEKRASRVKSITLTGAVAEYIKDKRRSDGLALKPRTKADYLAMVTPGRVTAKGKRCAGGLLWKLAGKQIHSITAGDVWTVHRANLERGERCAAYAMQVLRAVLSWHGVIIPNSPFSKETHGKERIVIPKTREGDDAAIKNLLEHIGPWWQALKAMPQSPATDYIAFLALTGCRPSEPLQVLVADIDLAGGRVTLRDTKNRTNHTLRLSRQALDIVEHQAMGKGPTDYLFVTSDARAIALELVTATGIKFTPKTLRAVFASAAEELVSASTLKRMMNHKQAGDVTDTNYIKKLEVQLRAGWQSVADYIEAQAASARADNVVQLRGGAT